MEAKVRMAEIRKLQQVSLNAQGNWPPGSLQNKIQRDVENIASLTSNLVNNIFPSIVTIVVAIVLTLKVSPLLTLFFLITAPLAMILRNAFAKGFSQRNSEFRKRLENMNSRVLEMIELLPVTRAHALEDAEIQRTGGEIISVKEEGKRLDFTAAWFGATAWVVFMSAQILSLVVMVWMAVNHKMTVGEVLMFQSYFSSVMGAMNGLINLMPDLARGSESIRSIGEVLENRDIEHNTGKPAFGAVRGHFKFESVCYSYPGTDKDAVQDFTLDVPEGSTVAIVGESGSGKSTLMHLAIGFLRPDSGSILLDGKNLTNFDLRTYRQQIATVPQQYLIFRGSLRDNITYGLRDVNDKRLWEVLEYLGAEEFVRELPGGLDADLGNHGAGLSGGQKQRIVMARALVRDPRVVILDEPTSALDAGSEAEVREAISRLCRGRTVFLVTHRLDSIGDANVVVSMRKGKIVNVS
jgi:ATP-binding cassette subfamily B protein